jgi:hypothetical protein
VPATSQVTACGAPPSQEGATVCATVAPSLPCFSLPRRTRASRVPAGKPSPVPFSLSWFQSTLGPKPFSSSLQTAGAPQLRPAAPSRPELHRARTASMLRRSKSKSSSVERPSPPSLPRRVSRAADSTPEKSSPRKTAGLLRVSRVPPPPCLSRAVDCATSPHPFLRPQGVAGESKPRYCFIVYSRHGCWQVFGPEFCRRR